ncbi:MAG TPA: hypothetical protein VGK54_08695 [Chloroflexota bacterium]
MPERIDRDLVGAFEGPNGTAELYEVVITSAEQPGAEQVHYEIVYGESTETLPTLGEASIRASELSGDPRFGSG